MNPSQQATWLNVATTVGYLKAKRDDAQLPDANGCVIVTADWLRDRITELEATLVAHITKPPSRVAAPKKPAAAASKKPAASSAAAAAAAGVKKSAFTWTADDTQLLRTYMESEDATGMDAERKKDVLFYRLSTQAAERGQAPPIKDMVSKEFVSYNNAQDDKLRAERGAYPEFGTSRKPTFTEDDIKILFENTARDRLSRARFKMAEVQDILKVKMSDTLKQKIVDALKGASSVKTVIEAIRIFEGNKKNKNKMVATAAAAAAGEPTRKRKATVTVDHTVPANEPTSVYYEATQYGKDAYLVVSRSGDEACQEWIQINPEYALGDKRTNFSGLWPKGDEFKEGFAQNMEKDSLYFPLNYRINDGSVQSSNKKARTEQDDEVKVKKQPHKFSPKEDEIIRDGKADGLENAKIARLLDPNGGITADQVRKRINTMNDKVETKKRDDAIFDILVGGGDAEEVAVKIPFFTVDTAENRITHLRKTWRSDAKKLKSGDPLTGSYIMSSRDDLGYQFDDITRELKLPEVAHVEAYYRAKKLEIAEKERLAKTKDVSATRTKKAAAPSRVSRLFRVKAHHTRMLRVVKKTAGGLDKWQKANSGLVRPVADREDEAAAEDVNFPKGYIYGTNALNRTTEHFKSSDLEGLIVELKNVKEQRFDMANSDTDEEAEKEKKRIASIDATRTVLDRMKAAAASRTKRAAAAAAAPAASSAAAYVAAVNSPDDVVVDIIDEDEDVPIQPPQGKVLKFMTVAAGRGFDHDHAYNLILPFNATVAFADRTSAFKKWLASHPQWRKSPMQRNDVTLGWLSAYPSGYLVNVEPDNDGNLEYPAPIKLDGLPQLQALEEEDEDEAPPAASPTPAAAKKPSVSKLLASSSSARAAEVAQEDHDNEVKIAKLIKGHQKYVLYGFKFEPESIYVRAKPFEIVMPVEIDTMASNYNGDDKDEFDEFVKNNDNSAGYDDFEYSFGEWMHANTEYSLVKGQGGPRYIGETDDEVTPYFIPFGTTKQRPLSKVPKPVNPENYGSSDQEENYDEDSSDADDIVAKYHDLHSDDPERDFDSILDDIASHFSLHKGEIDAILLKKGIVDDQSDDDDDDDDDEGESSPHADIVAMYRDLKKEDKGRDYESILDEIADVFTSIDRGEIADILGEEGIAGDEEDEDEDANNSRTIIDAYRNVKRIYPAMNRAGLVDRVVEDIDVHVVDADRVNEALADIFAKEDKMDVSGRAKLARASMRW